MERVRRVFSPWRLLTGLQVLLSVTWAVPLSLEPLTWRLVSFPETSWLAFPLCGLLSTWLSHPSSQNIADVCGCVGVRLGVLLGSALPPGLAPPASAAFVLCLHVFCTLPEYIVIICRRPGLLLLHYQREHHIVWLFVVVVFSLTLNWCCSGLNYWLVCMRMMSFSSMHNIEIERICNAVSPFFYRHEMIS